ncbi:MAG: hypothetical protein Q4E51_08090 [Lachnospiraceae bacterium]|nr:hypothetical protein [Lachnospiraceae bacterium]
MKNKTVNKKVIKAISIGLSAMMAMQPVLATPVLAEELGGDDNAPVENLSNESENNETQVSESAPSVSETTNNTIEVVNNITGYQSEGGEHINGAVDNATDAANATGDAIDYATDLSKLSTASDQWGNKYYPFPNDISNGKKDPVNEGQFIQANDTALKKEMQDAVDADKVASEAAKDAATKLQDVSDALKSVDEAVNEKASEESEKTILNEQSDAMEDAAQGAEDAVSTGNEKVDAALAVIRNTMSEAEAGQAVADGKQAIADAEDAVNQYGEALEEASKKYTEAAEKAATAETEYNNKVSAAEAAVKNASDEYDKVTAELNDAIEAAGKAASDLQTKTIEKAVERFNEFVVKLGQGKGAELQWTEAELEEAKNNPAKGKELAEKKYNEARALAKADIERTKADLDNATEEYNKAVANKKAADDAWSAITDAGLKTVAEAQYKCDNDSSPDWGTTGHLNTLFSNIMKYYYVENNVVTEGKFVPGSVTCTFKQEKDSAKRDDNNYFLVTYKVVVDGEEVEVTKYFNFKTGANSKGTYNKTANELIIFERSDELNFEIGENTSLKVLKTDLTFDKHNGDEASYTAEDGTAYTIVKIATADGDKYFALNAADTANAGVPTDEKYADTDTYKVHEDTATYSYSVTDEGKLVKTIKKDVTTITRFDLNDEANTYANADGAQWHHPGSVYNAIEDIKNMEGYDEENSDLSAKQKPGELVSYTSGLYESEAAAEVDAMAYKEANDSKAYLGNKVQYSVETDESAWYVDGTYTVEFTTTVDLSKLGIQVGNLRGFDYVRSSISSALSDLTVNDATVTSVVVNDLDTKRDIFNNHSYDLFDGKLGKKTYTLTSGSVCVKYTKTYTIDNATVLTSDEIKTKEDAINSLVSYDKDVFNNAVKASVQGKLSSDSFKSNGSVKYSTSSSASANTDNLDATQKYYFTAEYNKKLFGIKGYYGIKTNEDVATVTFDNKATTLQVNASNGLYNRFIADNTKTAGLFFTYGVNEDEDYKNWLGDTVNKYENTITTANILKAKGEEKTTAQKAYDLANGAMKYKTNNLTTEQRTAMEKAYAYNTALDALNNQKAAVEAAKDALEAAKTQLEDIKAAHDVEYISAQLNALEAKVNAAQKKYDDAKDALKKLQGRVAELESAYTAAINRIAEANRSSEGGSGSSSTPVAAPVYVAAATPVAPMFAFPTADAGVAGARTGRRAAGNGVEEELNAGVAGVKVDEAAQDEITPTTEDKKVTIEDNEIPLSAIPTDETQKMNWWWLLLVAALGATGEEMYRRNKNKKKEALASEIKNEAKKQK